MDQQEMRPLERISAAKTETLEGPRSNRILHQAEMSALDLARAYSALGWSIVPLIPRSKQPAAPWADFQVRHATDLEVRSWWAGSSNGIGIVAGTVSGIVVVDIDGPEGERAVAQRQLPVTPTVITARGRHRYFRHPGGAVGNKAGVLTKVDVRGDGGLVVAPPSIHQSGHMYAWEEGLSPWQVQLAECPEWVYEPDRTAEPSHGVGTSSLGSWQARACIGVGKGARNSTAASILGHLLARGVEPHVAATLLRTWNQVSCHPPLPDSEVDAVIESIAERELAMRRTDRRE